MSEDIHKKYPLGTKYDGVVLNHREVMCIHYLLRRFSISKISKQMKLSPRTVNFYINSVMLKLKCNSLPQLLNCVKQTELLRYFD